MGQMVLLYLVYLLIQINSSYQFESQPIQPQDFMANFRNLPDYILVPMSAYNNSENQNNNIQNNDNYFNIISNSTAINFENNTVNSLESTNNQSNNTFQNTRQWTIQEIQQILEPPTLILDSDPTPTPTSNSASASTPTPIPARITTPTPTPSVSNKTKLTSSPQPLNAPPSQTVYQQNLIFGCSNDNDTKQQIEIVTSFCALENGDQFQTMINMEGDIKQLCCNLVGRIQYCICEGAQIEMNNQQFQLFNNWNNMCGLDGYTCLDITKTNALDEIINDPQNIEKSNNQTSSQDFFQSRENIYKIQDSIYDVIFQNQTLKRLAFGFQQIQNDLADQFTVFAPPDDAFQNLKSIDLEASKFQNLIKYHIIQTKIDPLGNWFNMTVKTMFGENLIFQKSQNQQVLKVFGVHEDVRYAANVTGSLVFEDAVVYFIDKVLKPLNLFKLK